MENNLFKKYIKDAKSLPKTWDDIREAYKPLDTMSIDELETLAKNGKIYMAVYANCLLKARQTGKYAEVNRFRKKIGMSVLKGEL